MSTEAFVKRVLNQREVFIRSSNFLAVSTYSDTLQLLDTSTKAPPAKLFCGLCKKNFSTEKSLENHLSSNKHKLAETKVEGEKEAMDTSTEQTPAGQRVPKKTSASQSELFLLVLCQKFL